MQNPWWENNLRFIPKKRKQITEIRNIPMVVFLTQFKMYASKYVNMGIFHKDEWKQEKNESVCTRNLGFRQVLV